MDPSAVIQSLAWEGIQAKNFEGQFAALRDESEIHRNGTAGQRLFLAVAVAVFVC